MATRTTIGMLALTALAVGACGSTKKYADQPRPPLPVQLTVYINDARVSVSPATVTPGPIVLTVTNQAATAEALQVAGAGGGSLATTGPINPQGATQVGVELPATGTYTLSAQGSGSGGPAAAQLHATGQRGSAAAVLLTP